MKKRKQDDDKTPLIKRYNKLNLIYNSKDSFYKYLNIKKIDNNLKHEIDFITKQNKILVEHTIKNGISPLLSNCKVGNNIHEHGKQ